MNHEELKQIKEQAFLEGVIATVTKMKFLVEREKDPKVAVEKLLKEIDYVGKESVKYLSAIFLDKFATIIGSVNP